MPERSFVGTRGDSISGSCTQYRRETGKRNDVYHTIGFPVPCASAVLWWGS
jgi:hypothetical protein